jgi:hypothetical protein
MFGFFNMSTFPLDFDVIETDDVDASRRLLPEPVYKAVSKNFKLKAVTYPSSTSSLLKVTLKGDLTLRAGVGYQILKDSLKSGFEAKAFLDGVVDLNSAITLDWKKGNVNWKEEIRALEPFKLFELPVPKTLFSKLPKPKIGVYLDVSSYAKYEFSASEAGSMTIDTNVKLGGKRVSLIAKAPLTSKPTASLGKKQIAKPLLSVNPKVTTAISNETEASFNAQTGLQVGLYLTMFDIKAGVYQNALLEFDTTAVSAADNALAATTNKGVVIGDCRKCHRIGSSIGFRLGALKWSVSFFNKFKPDGVVLSTEYPLDLASVCQLPVNLPTCGKVCCAGDLECYEGVCRIPIQPPPVSAPRKPPTSAPLRPPTSAPLRPPTSAPLRAPTSAPRKAPTAAPLRPPTSAPRKAPTAAPRKAPTAAPRKAPTSAPLQIVVV